MQFDNPVTSRIPIKLEDVDLINKIVLESKNLNELYTKLKNKKENFYNRLINHFECIKINKTLLNYEFLDFKKFNIKTKRSKI